MKYLSVCSGIEAATVAWHDLGWTPVAFSEIEKFPSAVLAHHYPDVPNVGDMTQFKEWNLEPINLLVGGTPCQSFSVAGLRKGLDDPRGNLMLTFLAIAERERPQWIVWENVPGVLSSNGGRDFGTFLAALGELGYGWAYRVLDAQWFGVAQRRRRVFVVGCLGDQASAAAVLFESESVQRNPAPSREKGQGVAGGVIPSVAGSFDTECGGGKLTHQSVANGHIIGTITARMFNSLGARDVEEGALLPVAQPVAKPITFGAQMSVPQTDIDMVQTLQAKNPMAVAQPAAYGIDEEQNASRELFGCLKARMGGGGFEGTVAQPVAIQDVRAVEKAQNGRGWNDDGTAYTVDTYATQGVAVAQPIAIQGTLIGRGDNAGPQGSGVDERGSMFTLTKTDVHAVAQPVAFSRNDDGCDATLDLAPTMRVAGRAGGMLGVAQPMALGTDCYNGAITGEVAATIGTPGSSVNASGPTVMQPVAPALTASNDPSRSPQSSEVTQQVTAVHSVTMQVRRLTPTECERLQGFPDGYTNIPWRKKDEAPDGPRYKALGNSMAVPCMAWIGQRIAEVDRGD